MNRKSAGKRCAITRTIQIVLHVEFGHIHVNAMRMRWKRQKTNKHNNYLLVKRCVERERSICASNGTMFHALGVCVWRVTVDSVIFHLERCVHRQNNGSSFIVMKKMLLTLHTTTHFILIWIQLYQDQVTHSPMSLCDRCWYSIYNSLPFPLPFGWQNEMNRIRIWSELLRDTHRKRKKAFSQKLRYQFRLNSDTDALWTEPWQSKRFTTNYLICLDNRTVSLSHFILTDKWSDPHTQRIHWAKR